MPHHTTSYLYPKGGHTHAHTQTCILMICSFKKPGALAFGRHTCGLEVLLTTQESKTILPQT